MENLPEIVCREAKLHLETLREGVSTSFREMSNIF